MEWFLLGTIVWGTVMTLYAAYLEFEGRPKLRRERDEAWARIESKDAQLRWAWQEMDYWKERALRHKEQIRFEQLINEQLRDQPIGNELPVVYGPPSNAVSDTYGPDSPAKVTEQEEEE